MNKQDFSQIPANACVLNVTEFSVGDNGENAKTAPITMLARSSQPIEHWFWGRVVHDVSGFKSKSRIPIDYAHDDKEIIGYLNHFDKKPEGLVVSGALVPFKDSDRATEIIHKMKHGVPYEASINFSGEGIKLQPVEEGETTEVNGFTFSGPGVVIREYPLRSVAVCPHGADGNTESALLSDGKQKMFAAEIITVEQKQEENEMAKKELSAEVEAPEVEVVAAEEAEKEVVAEVEEAVEAQAEEAPVEAEEKPEAKELSERELFASMKAAFGIEIASEVFEAGGTLEDAREKFTQKIVAENEELRARVSELSQKNGGSPAEFTGSDRVSKSTRLFSEKAYK